MTGLLLKMSKLPIKGNKRTYKHLVKDFDLTEAQRDSFYKYVRSNVDKRFLSWKEWFLAWKSGVIITPVEIKQRFEPTKPNTALTDACTLAYTELMNKKRYECLLFIEKISKAAFYQYTMHSYLRDLVCKGLVDKDQIAEKFHEKNELWLKQHRDNEEYKRIRKELIINSQKLTARKSVVDDGEVREDWDGIDHDAHVILRGQFYVNTNTLVRTLIGVDNLTAFTRWVKSEYNTTIYRADIKEIVEHYLNK